MTTTPGLDLWGSYHRMPVRAGWSYPLAQLDLRGALEAADLSVDEAVLFHAPGAKDRAAAKVGTMALLSAMWDGRSSKLWVYAVPAEHRAAARSIALHEALPGAISWLKALPGRGNAWTATRREWRSMLDRGGLVIEEVEAEYPAAGSTIGGW